MIDLERDRLLSFSEAARFIPGTPHLSTLHRWRLRGVRGQKLPTLLIGGRRFIALSELKQFVAALSGDASGPATPAPMERGRALAEAERELDAAGI